MNICQSCSMPMASEEVMGRNGDGSVNEDYCIHCYKDGDFSKPEETFEEMVASCIPPFMVQEGLTEDEAKAKLIETLKPLKRWQ